MRQQQQTQDRANRAAELQDLLNVYKILQAEDHQAQVQSQFSGTPYQPNPALKQTEERLQGLVTGPGNGGLLATQRPSGGGLLAQGMSPPAGGLNGERGLTEQRGDGSLQVNAPGLLSQPSPMPSGPAPAHAAPMPAIPPSPVPMPTIGQRPSLPALLQNAGIDPRIAAMWASTPQGERELYAQLAKAYGPRLSNGIMMQLTPGGGTRFLGGTVGNNSVPVTTDAGGNLQLRPVPGAIGYQAQREGAITAAQEAAKAQRDLVPIPQPDGSVRYMSRAQAIGMTGQGGMQFPGTDNGQIPPNVQAQRDEQRMTILQQERSRQLAQTGRVDPALEREIQLVQGGAPGFSAGQSTAAKVAAEVNPKLQLESLAKSYDDNLKAANGLVFLDAARKAVNGATTTGLFAKPALLAARIGSAFGVTDPAAAADPETFLALSARSVMQTIKSLGSGSGISDADREYAARAMGGDIKLNKESINRLLDIQERATRIMVQQHNRKVEQAAKNGVPSVYDYQIEIPNSSSSGNVVTLPDGRTATFPNAQAAEQFKRAAGFQ